MKRVLLLGDSIRIGYQDYLKELLKEECEVIYWADDNGRFVQYNYWQLNQMFRIHGHFDIVHFNNGYWDMNIEPPCEEALNPIPEYIAGLKKIVTYIKKQKAIPIFANTVPIYSDGSSNDNTGTKASITYKNEWVIDYNKAAESLMKKENVQINDMYSRMLSGPKYFKCPDMLHLTESGYKECAILTAETIRKHL